VRGKWVRDEQFVSEKGEPSVGVKLLECHDMGLSCRMWSLRGCCTVNLRFERGVQNRAAATEQILFMLYLVNS
jgi:hypothetical protein